MHGQHKYKFPFFFFISFQEAFNYQNYQINSSSIEPIGKKEETANIMVGLNVSSCKKVFFFSPSIRIDKSLGQIFPKNYSTDIT